MMHCVSMPLAGLSEVELTVIAKVRKRCMFQGTVGNMLPTLSAL